MAEKLSDQNQQLVKGKSTNAMNQNDLQIIENITGRRVDPSVLNLNLPEDMRMSKLLRRLLIEKNASEAKALCEKIRTVMLDKTNATYIRRSFRIISGNLEECLREAPIECHQQLIEIFGILAYMMRQEMHTFKKIILDMYEISPTWKLYSMRILLQMLKIDAKKKLDLSDKVGSLMGTLKDLLEKVDDPELFLTIISVIQQIALNYPKQFQPQFEDIVDIIVGWHLDSEQSLNNVKVKNHCCNFLSSLEENWEGNINLMSNLLNQIVEDMLQCREEYTDLKKSTDISFGPLLAVYNTLMKSCIQNQQREQFFLGERVVKVNSELILENTIFMYEKTRDTNIAFSINEYITIVLTSYPENREMLNSKIMEVIEMQLVLPDRVSDVCLTSLLFVSLQYVMSIKNDLNLDFLGKLLDFITTQRRIKFTSNSVLLKSVKTVCSEILNIKNVAILEKTYSYIKEDLVKAIHTLFGDPNNSIESEYNELEAQYLINFYIAILTPLATTNSSIIAMWALKPTLLELFMNILWTNEYDWEQYPFVFLSMLKMIYGHCQINSNFITASNLFRAEKNKINNTFSKLTTEMSPTSSHSPSAGNFENILKFLEYILSVTSKEENIQILIEWCHNIISGSFRYSEKLKENSNFLAILKSIIDISLKYSIQVTILCAECLNLIVWAEMNTELLKELTDVCYIHMCSVNSEVRNKFSYILAKVPLKVSLIQAFNYTGNCKESDRRISELQHWHTTNLKQANLRGSYFKDFVEHISFNENALPLDDMLVEAFINSWCCQNLHDEEFEQVATKDIRTLVNWIQWEAAHYCVSNKLRTVVGKPQETFLKFESIIKEYARVLALKEKVKFNGIKSLLASQKHARILLGFMETLEKMIYNAAEGTAAALPQADKVVKTFFYTNMQTCNEWFNRIRTAVDLVALHSMEPEMVIRYSESILKTLLASGGINEALFEHTLMSLAWALLRNGESDALTGLYIWSRNVTNRRYGWLKPAADQAAGKHYAAVKGYQEIYNSSEYNKLDRHIREFIFDQLVLCYVCCDIWEELRDLLNTGNEIHKDRVTIPLQAITAEQVQFIIDYEKNRDKSLLQMSDWTVFTDESSVPANFSYHHLVTNIESTMYFLNFHVIQDKQSAFDVCNTILHCGIQECLRTKSREHLSNLLTLNHISYLLNEKTQNPDNCKISGSSLYLDKRYSSLDIYRAYMWYDFMEGDTNITEEHIKFQLDMCTTSFKEGNPYRCKSGLENYFKNNFRKHGKEFSKKLNIDEIVDNCMTSSILTEPEIWNDQFARALHLSAKYLFENNQKSKAIQFCATISKELYNKLEILGPSSQLKERFTRCLLTLAEWVYADNDCLAEGSPLSVCIDKLTQKYEVCFGNPVIPKTDFAAGRILRFTVDNHNDHAEAWGRFGNWCYRWGRKIFENRNENYEKLNLSTEDLADVKHLFPNVTNAEMEEIVEILNQHKIAFDDEEIGSSGSNATEKIEKMLRSLNLLKNASDADIKLITDVWHKGHESLYNFYKTAAEAYFNYLKFVTTSNESSNDDNGDGAFNNDECSSLTATLRLLRLIVKHAVGLQNTLEMGLESTPTKPWKVIIPQLFSRLNHHEPYVRRRVSELLCRIAVDSSHIIIFPAVVGIEQECHLYPPNLSLNNVQYSASEDIIHQPCDTMKSSILTSCFSSLLQTLTEQSPELVNHVQVFVNELRRISLLWDELWVTSISQIYSEVSRRFSSFQNDFQKMSETIQLEKTSVLIETHRILMRPVVFIIERLHEITSRVPETRYEKIFQEKYLDFILESISIMKKPFDQKKPNNAWHRFKLLYITFQQSYQKRVSSMLRMSDISPILSDMKNTLISMPGIETSNNKVVYIQSVENHVHILPTKTKPKKLAFIGSDGKRYTYLFKGLEDLHLDERIMQFLAIANSMMTRRIDSYGNNMNYRAKNYSVVPLGPRSGLISWVDGVVPIFSLYKKWQQREAAHPKKDKQSVMFRPTDLYYNKLTPLLAKHNLDPAKSSRAEWPVEVMKQVLGELINETPKDLIAKELWCHSTNAASWRQVIRTYSVSVAVMSVIGYVIGLGDRHLDNILINLSTGEIVHIDYNVCFEKGKTLRVPEKVPFRMTPNLEEALGVTGIEGIFRDASEHVLRTLKKGRESLLTLLEAFVYDPLVDWAVSEHGDGVGGLPINAYNGVNLDKNLRLVKQLDYEINRDKLMVRFIEVTPKWLINRELLYDTLKNVSIHTTKAINSWREVKHYENQRNLISKSISTIREAEALGSAITSHQLNTLSQRYKTYKKENEPLDSVINQLKCYSKCFHGHLDELSLCYEQIGKSSKINTKACLRNIKEILNYIQIGGKMELFGKLNELVGGIEENEKCNTDIVKSCNIFFEYFDDLVNNLSLEKFDRKSGCILIDCIDKLLKNNTIEAAEEARKVYQDQIEIKPSKLNESLCKQMLNIVDTQNERKLYLAEELKKFKINGNNDDLIAKIKESTELVVDEQFDQCLFTSVLKQITPKYKTTTDDDTKSLSIAKKNVNLMNYLSIIKTTIEMGSTAWKEKNLVITSIDNLSEIHHKTTVYKNQLISIIYQGFGQSVFQEVNGAYDALADLIEMRNSFAELTTIVNIFNLKLTTEKHMRIADNLHNKFEKIIQKYTKSNSYFSQLYNSIQSYLNNLNGLTLVIDNFIKECNAENAKTTEVNINTNLNFVFLIQKVNFLYNILTVLCCLENSTLSKKYEISTDFSLNKLMKPLTNMIYEIDSFIFMELTKFIRSIVISRFNLTVGFLETNKDYDLETLIMEINVDIQSTTKNIEDKQSSYLEDVIKSIAEHVDRNTLITISMENIELLDMEITLYRRVLRSYRWLYNQLPDNCNTESITIDPTLIATDSINSLVDWINKSNYQYELLKSIMYELSESPEIEFVKIELQNVIKDIERVFESQELIKINIDKWLPFLEKLIKMNRTDDNLLKLLNRYENLMKAQRSSKGKQICTPTEIILAEMYDPDSSINDEWLKNIGALADETYNSTLNDYIEAEKKLKDVIESLPYYNQSLKDSIGLCLEMSQDIRPILKSCTKINSSLSTIIKRYISKCKEFNDYIAMLLSYLESNDLSMDILEKTQKLMNECMPKLNYIFNELLIIQSEIQSLSEPDVSDEIESSNINVPNQQQKEQKRNAFAVSVWRRIRLKLEGRDPDVSKRCTVSEQIDYIIREAMEPTNLAVLYEGWTPWV